MNQLISFKHLLLVLLISGLLFSNPMRAVAIRVDDHEPSSEEKGKARKPPASEPEDTGKKEKVESKEKYVTMNFDEADIRLVIKFISDLTGKNFIIDDKVKGTVTTISPTKLTIDEVYRVFLSILEVKGFTAVPAGKAIKIIPSKEAKYKDVVTRTVKEAAAVEREDRMVTQIVPLAHANANELKGLFTPLVSKDSSIISYPHTNTLIVTDYASNIHRLMRIIKEIDIKGEEEKITVVKLEYAQAKVIATNILPVLGEKRKARVKKPVPTRRRPRRGREPQISVPPSIIKIIPDERTNSLIILATQTDTERIIELIKKLDQPIPKGLGRIHVYYLENANADELVKVLSKLPEKGKKAPKGAVEKAPIIGPDVSITADKPTNSLIITASPEDYQLLKGVIEKLDILRPQVLVEALITEVSLDVTKQLGIEWFAAGEKGDTSVFGTAGLPQGQGPVSTSTLPSLPSITGLAFGALGGPITIAGQEIFSISALIRALQTSTDANIIATPTLLTMDNEEAEIIIGEERPFLRSDIVTQTGTTVTGQGTITRTFEFKDVATTLRITPQISKGDMVRLKIFQEVKRFREQAGPETGAVITTKRQAKTTVVVQNGQIVIIGGLLQDEKRSAQTAIPCLGSIPILGWAFKSLNQGKNKLNLLVFITPHIIRSPEDMIRMTREIREKSERSREEYETTKKRDIQENIDILLHK